MHTVVVREHARLTTGSGVGSLDVAYVPPSAFDWLCKESARLRSGGAPLVRLDDRNWLRLDNYVGVVETPCGTRIEILPKSFDDAEDADRSRALLRRMLSRCMGLKPRETGPASIQAFKGPLTEWVMRQFLEALDTLVKRGLRFDYRAVRDTQPYLRGRLDVARQLRQPAGRQHVFRIEHDVFDADRPENRLLCAALDRVCRATRDADNWRLSHELAMRLAGIPRSNDTSADFRRWRDDRLLAHYRPVRPWCELILGQQLPFALAGAWRGHSLLFPMEMLFERYVEACLRRTLPPGATLRPSAQSEFLCTHRGEEWFKLKPDFLIGLEGRQWVLDTKWKRLDAGLDNARDKYGLNQADFYQLFAYGHRYPPAGGDLILVYPKTAVLQKSLPPFDYRDGWRLRVIPFDLERGELEESFVAAAV